MIDIIKHEAKVLSGILEHQGALATVFNTGSFQCLDFGLPCSPILVRCGRANASVLPESTNGAKRICGGKFF
jgi:hypothetical protein